MGARLTTAFIFDFDGTLVDSEQAIYQCFQRITKQLAPERLGYAKNILIGPPLRDTASEILGPQNQNILDEFVRLFIEMHDERIIHNTQPFPGVVEVLRKFHNKNIFMAIATNKRLAPTKKLIDHFSWNNYFQLIECSDSQQPMRNKAEIIKDIIKQNKIFKGSYFVGDTVNDGLSANLNQLPFIKACYGYGKNEDWSKVNIWGEIEVIYEIEKLVSKGPNN